MLFRSVAVVNSMLPNHSIPVGAFTANSRFKATKDDELVSIGTLVMTIFKSALNLSLISSDLALMGAYRC